MIRTTRYVLDKGWDPRWIRARRNYLTHSQAHLARTLDLVPHAISQYEGDKKVPSLATFFRLVEEMGGVVIIEFSDFAYDEDKAPEASP